MKGEIVQVIGPVVDVYFEDVVPAINNALLVEVSKEDIRTLEVALQLGDHIVRTIAIEATEGLARGMKVEDTGQAIKVPVGNKVLGRVFNVLGETIDNGEKLKVRRKMPIHKAPPAFHELHGEIEILETGIKVIDLLAPYIKGGKIGLFGGAVRRPSRRRTPRGSGRWSRRARGPASSCRSRRGRRGRRSHRSGSVRRGRGAATRPTSRW